MDHNGEPLRPGVDPVQPPQPPPQWVPNMQQQFNQLQQQLLQLQQQVHHQQAGHANPPPQQPAAVAAVAAAAAAAVVSEPRVTPLPSFWPANPVAWFNMIESTFHRCKVVDVHHKFDLVLPALPESALDQIRDILGIVHTLADPYAIVKKELVRQYTPNKLQQMNRLIYAPELGGQQPSQLMKFFIANLPEGEPEGLLFKHLWLHRLPEDLRDQVAKKIELLDARQLAEYADGLWHVRNARRPPGKTVAAIGMLEPSGSGSLEMEELTDAVAALPVMGRSRNRGGKGREKAGRPAVKQPWICFNHTRWGEKTWECQDSKNCTFLGNGKAGGQ